MNRPILPPQWAVPGTWPGSVAAGVVPQERISPATGKVETTPVGERAAEQFPWISSIMLRQPVAAGSVQRFVRPGTEPSFYNNTNRPVYVDEIRIYALPMPQIPQHAGAMDLNIGRRLGCRIYSQHKEYIRDWLPLWNIQTESNRMMESMRYRGVFQLPAPYFLDKGNTFQLRTRCDWPLLAAANITTDQITIAPGLQGMRRDSSFPIKLMRQVALNTVHDPGVGANPATPVNPIYTVIPFDDGRDFPIQDMRVTHIGMGVHDYMLSVVAATDIEWTPMAWIMFQFVAPQGPKWMGDNDWVPLWGLWDQVGPVVWEAGVGPGGIWDHSMIVHRPITPYVINPREELSVELRTNIAMTYTPDEDVAGWVESGRGVPIWCTMYGRQESLA